MKLPEAIALMLEGKVMVDGDGIFVRMWRAKYSSHFQNATRTCRWGPVTYLAEGDGWREATPEELKEIGA